MPILNGSFEDGTGGNPDDWTYTTSGSVVEFAEFSDSPHDVAWDSFEVSWAGIDLIPYFEGFYVDVKPADFEVGPGQEPYEDYEEEWAGLFLPTLSSSELAVFAPSSATFESYEEGWGNFWWTLPAVEYASFDVTPEDFEDYEDGFGLLPQELKDSFDPGDLEEALFDGAANAFESYEDPSWPPLVL